MQRLISGKGTNGIITIPVTGLTVYFHYFRKKVVYLRSISMQRVHHKNLYDT
jgi:hypothetical protein